MEKARGSGNTRRASPERSPRLLLAIMSAMSASACVRATRKAFMQSSRGHISILSRISILFFCALAVFTLVSCKPSPKQKKLSAIELRTINVVVITLDTVRADHLHCYGNQNIQTPTIDSLAQRGVLFEKVLAQTPLTEPSHASIFTGENPNVHRVRDNGFVLQPSSLTLATILRGRGWDTAGFISASDLNRQFGFNQGFSTYDDEMSQSTDMSMDQPVAVRPANITVDHAIRWLNHQSGKPFFVWLHLYDAHQPYHPPEYFLKQYPNDPYDAEIAFEDQQIGRFLNVVRKKSPDGKTLILLLSDHGEGLGQHEEDGHGVFLYDSTIRIAWIMDGPGIPAGIRVQQQAREIDVLPTVLDLLGGKASPAVQGRSMAPAFSGKTVPTTYSYEETLYPKINMGWSELRGIHTPHWMYVRAPRPELYDLDHDPDEVNNVIAAHPKEYRKLDAQLKQLSRLGSSNTETVATPSMNQKTIDQLRSLGYVGGSSGGNIELNGQGPDPKDMLNVILLFNSALGLDGRGLPTARKIALLQQAIRQNPINPYLYSALSDQYKQIGQNELALQACLTALHYNLQNKMILSRVGDLYMHAGHPKEALLFFQRAARLNPSDVENQSNLASAYMHNGQLEDAERIFRSIIASQPYAPAYNGLGIVALNRRDFITARTHFNQALQLNPDNVEAEYNLGIACAQTHDLPCAQTAFQEFLSKASPANQSLAPQAEYNLGIACAQTHDLPCAQTALQAFLAKASSAYQNLVPQAEYYLGIVCTQTHDISCVRTAFRAFLAKISPAYQDLVPQAEYNLGVACVQAHDIPCARTAFRAFLAKVTPEYQNLVPQVKANLIALH
ncbi:MAG TPA: sulfatase-like hydrolase/transferase [Acidobacteriaceae bacterium]|nr:sulfatase-like hydrolase/transferase [Acidobacteriaceae bacterium]